MTEEIIKTIESLSEKAMNENPQWRKGQTLWNIAESYIYDKGTPEQINLFEDLRDSDAACFNNDDNIEAFLEALKNI